jgi:hypothetical protein
MVLRKPPLRSTNAPHGSLSSGDLVGRHRRFVGVDSFEEAVELRGRVLRLAVGVDARGWCAPPLGPPLLRRQRQ